ncbi:DUF1501 domain-containing protein [Humisphaera borealis]|uniref:DUF1501 domain-containing protein n=1 Tax=Humisphaera borealis TaxID=2807512 RepID=A0A7M2WX38_9BACT|nr:DUF1501 domain-containing protein [Humisphaera borealis]QOV89963.1 DUF1501 domain-containing protein [Humisphaera borealis]
MTDSIPSNLSRRAMLQTASCGFGYLALAGLCNPSGGATVTAPLAGATKSFSPMAPKQPPLQARAKRVIMLFMRGGPSHLDGFDYKPSLEKFHDKSMQADQFPEGAKAKSSNLILMRSPFEFTPHGKSGLPISSVFPNLAKHADDLCLINSMHHKTPIHLQGVQMMHTGHFQFIRPSTGSWVTYGLGAETTDLPGYVVMNPLREAMQCYNSAFLPAAYGATPINVSGEASKSIRNVANPRLTADQQKAQLALIQSMNRKFASQAPGASELEAVIESYERGFAMQSGVPRVLDMTGESPATLEAYGVGKGGKGGTGGFGLQCLMARRFAEQGVRFIELNHGSWDHHGDINKSYASAAKAIDQPIAALLQDLKDRGMLDETLVIWGGEFGRTSWKDGAAERQGRGHNSAGFTYWMAGGGIKGGMRYGATDETGTFAAENKVSVHDLQATILHQLGLDHWNLTYKYGGRDYRLSDVDGKVVNGIIA